MEHEADGNVLQEELEMMIPAIKSFEDEKIVTKFLRQINGVDSVAVDCQNVWLSFHAAIIGSCAICEMLKSKNYPPSQTLEDGHWIDC